MFGGSGTVAAVARATGRQYRYIDRSPEYCEAALFRVATAEPPPGWEVPPPRAVVPGAGAPAPRPERTAAAAGPGPLPSWGGAAGPRPAGSVPEPAVAPAGRSRSPRMRSGSPAVQAIRPLGAGPERPGSPGLPSGAP